MRYVQFSGPYPDQKKMFKKTRYVESLGINVGEYYGQDDTIADYTGEWPPVDREYRTLVTGQELMNLLDNVNPAIWLEIEDMTQQAAINFRAMIGRRLNSKIPIIALTADAMKNAQKECVKAGMKGYIPNYNHPGFEINYGKSKTFTVPILRELPESAD